MSKKAADIVTKELFYKEYIENNLTIAQIADKYDVSFPALKTLNARYYKIKKDRTKIVETTKQTNLEKYGCENPTQNEKVKQKIKDTVLDKYGVSCTLLDPKIKEKSTQTCVEHYGVDHPMKSEEIRNKIKDYKKTDIYAKNIKAGIEKRKANMVEKYGVSTNLLLEENIEKRNNVMVEKYGGKSAFCSKEVREKAHATMINKYGVEYPAQSEEIKNKIKSTNLEKYGYATPLKNEDVKSKIVDTNMSRYGIMYYCQSDKCLNSGSKNSAPNMLMEGMLNSRNIAFEREYSLENKVYDFKIDNVLLEVDPFPTHNSTWGVHGKSPTDRLYHLEKTNIAKNNNFRCIHIFDWDDPLKVLDIVSPKVKIAARKCEIFELKDKDTIDFLNENHLQGYCLGQKYCYGLYYNNELLEVMTFGAPRYNKKYQYELLRLCTKKGYSVIGGSERLFKYFINKMNPTTIISYCDNSKFDGSVYSKLGFCLINDGKPSKHWYNIKTKKHITDNLLRSKGYDQLFGTSYGKNTSNEKLMLENDFVEIYDCGQSTWLYKN